MGLYTFQDPWGDTGNARLLSFRMSATELLPTVCSGVSSAPDGQHHQYNADMAIAVS